MHGRINALSFYAWIRCPRFREWAQKKVSDRMREQHIGRRTLVKTFFAISVCACFPMCLYGRGMRAKPFVKWAGGKGQLLEQLDGLLPENLGTRKDLIYVEPFVGGGAMLFHMLTKYSNIRRAIINDLNADLIACYKVIKEQPRDLIEKLRALQDEYWGLENDAARKAMFLSKRERYNAHKADGVEISALFIFLNRTCFNGLYRVNSKGQFNVPFGRAKRPLVCDEDTILADSGLLQKVDILCGDFAEVMKAVKGKAFFYFDPPYRPLTQTSAFTAYSKNGFGDDQQRRLADLCKKLDADGNQWLLSNSDPHNVDPNDMFFEELYDGYEIVRVFANRMINAKASGRGRITELAIRNYRGD